MTAGSPGERPLPGIDNNYDLSDEMLQQRVADLIERLPPPSGKEIVCYRLDSDGMKDVARTVECRVFEKTFKNSPQEMADIYGPYEDGSSFFLSIDTVVGQPCGALRVSENSSAGMMTLNDLPAEATSKPVEEMLIAHQIDSLDDCWDVGTVAVLSEYRKREHFEVSTQLYRALYVSAMQQGIKHFLSIIDDKPYRMMTDYLGIPFKPLSGTSPFRFEGSKLSHAVHGYVPDFYKSMNRRRFTARGIMARQALKPLVKGTRDDALVFDSNY